MQKITAIIRIEKFDDVRAALEKRGYPGLSLKRIEGHGKQRGLRQQFRGREYTIEMLPKYELSIVVKDTMWRRSLRRSWRRRARARPGRKIFVSPSRGLPIRQANPKRPLGSQAIGWGPTVFRPPATRPRAAASTRRENRGPVMPA
jgi:nitrogen regulatory protein PII